jgi:hypothetical protein
MGLNNIRLMLGGAELSRSIFSSHIYGYVNDAPFEIDLTLNNRSVRKAIGAKANIGAVIKAIRAGMINID